LYRDKDESVDSGKTGKNRRKTIKIYGCSYAQCRLQLKNGKIKEPNTVIKIADE